MFINAEGFDCNEKLDERKIQVQRFRDKKMTDKLMYIHKDVTQISLLVDNNYWLKCLDTQLNESTNQT